MPLTLTATWPLEVYEAATVDPLVPEWPPDVVRPFCGMVAAAREDRDWEALRWLERQPPPLLWCTEAETGHTVRQSYVVTNAVARRGTHQSFPGRQAGRDQRCWARAFPARPLVHFVWPDAEPAGVLAAALAQLARRIAYVGRATSPAIVELATGLPPASALEGMQRFEPQDLGTGVGDRRLVRTPYPGYVDALRAAFEEGQPTYGVALPLPYVAATEPPSHDGDTPAAQGRYGDLVVLAFRPGTGPAGIHTVRVTSALRDSLRSRASEDLATVHGHHDGEVEQCAFLALPDVGHAHARGHLLGVATALPRRLPGRERQIVLRALLGDPAQPGGAGVTYLRVAGLGRFELIPPPVGRRSLRPQRWSRAARCWASVLPVVTDRFPKPHGAFAGAIADGCELAGLPRPAAVEVLRHSVVPGGVDLRPQQTVRRRGERHRLPSRHAVLHFEQPVHGPVVVGSMRHYGLGLCLPFDRRDLT